MCSGIRLELSRHVKTLQSCVLLGNLVSKHFNLKRCVLFLHHMHVLASVYIHNIFNLEVTACSGQVSYMTPLFSDSGKKKKKKNGAHASENTS